LARRSLVRLLLTMTVGALIAAGPSVMSGQGTTTGWKVVAWNNLGMHCMDADFSVFAILPRTTRSKPRSSTRRVTSSRPRRPLT